MKEIKTEDAVGQVLCHDLTQIIKGVTKDARFRKGHIVQAEDIPVLLSMGKENLFVFEAQSGFIHEDEAALRLCTICKGENMQNRDIKEGKIELFADCDGLFCYDDKELYALNDIGQISIAARGNYFPVKKGDKLAGMRVIPLMIDEKELETAENICKSEPLFNVLPYNEKRFGVVATGSEIAKKRIEDTFSPVVIEKLKEFGGECIGVTQPGDERDVIAADINAFFAKGADLVLCTGGMSVDPDDRTPAAIRAAGAEIISYGAPVLPGAMFLVSYLNGKPVLGLPGCVMFAKRTVLDLVLPRVFANLPVTKADLTKMGAGGLCLNCECCHFPNCGFGRSM
ncbi:MAG: molybdopterin-binding protein [Oscillospiraceae bacterium]